MSDLPIAGQLYAPTYQLRVSGVLTDLPAGGVVKQMDLYLGNALVQTLPGPAVRTGVGTYVFPAAIMPAAGAYTATTTYTVAAAGPDKVDPGDPFVVYAFAGAYGGPLITLDEALQYLGQQNTGAVGGQPANTADRAVLQGILDSAIARIQHDDLAGPVTPRQILAERHDGEDSIILLRRTPIISVDQVLEYRHGSGTPIVLTESTPAAPADGYQLDPDIAELRRVTYGGWSRAWWPGYRNIEITYTVGRTSVPPEVAEATLWLCAHFWTRRRGGTPQFSPSGQPYTTGMSYAVPQACRDLLGTQLRAPHL